MMDFRNTVNFASLIELNTAGPHYTWCNKRDGDLICKKLDRLLINQVWVDVFEQSYGLFDAGGCSDHLRASFTLQIPDTNKRYPFKFVNAIARSPRFLQTVSDFWSLTNPLHISTAAAFMFSKKLKALKPTLHRLGKAHIGHIQIRAKEAYDQLCTAQVANHNHPTTITIEVELEAQKKWEALSKIEEDFLRQKSKVHWLKMGDKNNGYFHRIAKQRQSKNSIRIIKDRQGNILTHQADIKEEAVCHFQTFLTTTPPNMQRPNIAEIKALVRHTCSETERASLTLAASDDEIKQTLFKMPRNKAPGPDGYTAEFYIGAWPVVGSDFTAAVKSFFEFGFLPKGMNSTILAMVPKKKDASEMKDYRPISCCNVIYKVISKILANRLKAIIPRLIHRNQSAFVEGRLLLENVLLATELVKDYHKDTISHRGTAKIDLAKAFDTIDWNFLRATLSALDIPDQFMHWIMLCVTTPSFSVQVNGALAGYFNSKRGLRQGCALSPYLFVMCINVLSSKLDAAALAGQIGYHPRCKKLFITHICFADDMLVFSDGSLSSLTGMIEVFRDFAKTSGLEISIGKSTLHLAGHSNNEKEEIFGRFGFSEGKFPIRYLGLPLHPKKLKMQECLPLISRIREKISTWTARYLSYAGRLQLINSVLKGITNFWLAAFCLPKKCMREIDSLCAAFLWSGPDLKSKKAKVAWEDVCCPKKEGGLGVRNLFETANVCYLKLIWRIISRQPSLWVSWIWDSLIKGRSFWLLKHNTCMGSWVWRKILQHRDQARSLIKIKIGNGKNISFWHDNWTDFGSLYELIGSRGVIDFGIPMSSTLFEAIHHHHKRRHRSPIMNQIENLLETYRSHQVDHEIEDQVLWRNSGTKYQNNFSSKFTWIHSRNQRLIKVWHKLIWFPNATPKFVFCSWLAFQDKLATRDRMRLWNNGIDPGCLLCSNGLESRNHIFFECHYSQEVWRITLGTLLESDHSSSWDRITHILLRHQNSRVRFFLIRYALQATIYHLWRERNNRNHGQQHINPRLMAKFIDKVVRNNITAAQTSDDSIYSLAMNIWLSTRI